MYMHMCIDLQTYRSIWNRYTAVQERRGNKHAALHVGRGHMYINET